MDHEVTGRSEAVKLAPHLSPDEKQKHRRVGDRLDRNRTHARTSPVAERCAGRTTRTQQVHTRRLRHNTDTFERPQKLSGNFVPSNVPFNRTEDNNHAQTEKCCQQREQTKRKKKQTEAQRSTRFPRCSLPSNQQ
ncbi:uncharacterized protein LOC125947450 [Dermacentor silvarum]|uniref:uncharacterized protein LOC125947450 n=1 Tax=Dermacentor silvarum TaxID=543639 RepID=UPI002101821D|nr:uncharacterized protein LOC125947450 [Dermacentor silvarum]